MPGWKTYLATLVFLKERSFQFCVKTKEFFNTKFQNNFSKFQFVDTLNTFEEISRCQYEQEYPGSHRGAAQPERQEPAGLGIYRRQISKRYVLL